ncbi:MAG TPA: GYF domain-containing protein, partial [Polyangiaceae bacterium]|nr:GYF domain-containing protein [Polyangiaceae bacterium]
MAFGVTCPTCGKAFSITDEIYQRKVSGKVVTIKCKQCQAGIRVDASKPGVTKISAAAKEAEADKAIETKSVGPLPPQAVAPAMAAPAAPAPVAPAPRMRQATLIGGVANTLGKQAQAAAAALQQQQVVPSVPPPPVPPPPPETLWAVEVGDGQDREMPFSELGREIERGTIPTTALAWREGMAEWLEIRQVPDLAAFVKKASQPKPAAAPVAPSPPAPLAAPKPAIKPAAAPRIAEAPMSEEAPTQPKRPNGPALPAPRAPMGS